MFANLPILSLLIFLPIFGGVACLLVGNERPFQARCVALFVGLLTLFLCLPLYLHFDQQHYQMQFVEMHPWLAHYGIFYHLGVDGISLPMVILSTFTTCIVVLASWQAIKTEVATYMALFLLMQGLMVGVFCALDAVLFYVFWEAMLIPMYLCIGIWGMENRSYASIKFFLYTFFGSALMLVALLYLFTKSHSFNILNYYPLPLTFKEQILLFLAFFLSFAVKVPMWPFHTWLPDAHTEAPAGGSVVLAALMLKMGVYGFLRFTLPIFPDASRYFAWPMIILSLIAIVYIAIVAIGQKNFKRLIAYSSIAHMGFATLACFMIFNIVAHTGIMATAYLSLEGAMVQMISHAFSTGALFFAVGILYTRLQSCSMQDYGGIANSMPVLAAFVMLFAMANVGLPGTSGFVGEFMILLSTFKADFWVTVFAASTLFLAAAYTLWFYKRVFFGCISNPAVQGFQDIHGSEKLVMIVLAVPVILIGIYPAIVLNIFHASVGHLLTLALGTKLLG